MNDALVFQLPDGRSAEVAPRPARLIYARLWELGIRPGAATAAARISDALHKRASSHPEVAFTHREADALIEAAKSHPPTWVGLSAPGTLSIISIAERRRLVDTCLELIDSLDAGGDAKLRALVDDLARLRDRLRSVTARELLTGAAGRVALGWCQGAEARAPDGRSVDVLDMNAASWSLLGALQAESCGDPQLDLEEIAVAVGAIAQLISDPSLADWNDVTERTQDDVHSLLERAETLTAAEYDN